MICYNGDILQKLKQAGFSSYVLRKEKLMGERTIQRLREGGSLSFDKLNLICELLDCELSDILIYVKDK